MDFQIGGVVWFDLVAVVGIFYRRYLRKYANEKNRESTIIIKRSLRANQPIFLIHKISSFVMFKVFCIRYFRKSCCLKHATTANKEEYQQRQKGRGYLIGRNLR